MKIYKIEMDLSNIISELSTFKLYEYNTPDPIVFIEAENADDACYQATYNLIGIILKQDMSKENRLYCKDLINEIRVTKVRVAE